MPLQRTGSRLASPLFYLASSTRIKAPCTESSGHCDSPRLLCSFTTPKSSIIRHLAQCLIDKSGCPRHRTHQRRFASSSTPRFESRFCPYETLAVSKAATQDEIKKGA